MMQRLKLRDVREIYQLIDACRDVGSDPTAWRTLLADALVHRFAARVCMTGEIEHVYDPSRAKALSLIDRGWAEDDPSRLIFLRYLQSGEYGNDPSVHRMIPLKRQLITRSRKQLFAPGEWERSVCFSKHYEPSGLDDMLLSIAQLREPLHDAYSMIVLHRPLGAQPFTARDRRWVHYLHHELQPHVGRTLADAQDPVAQLSQRLRQALQALLEGHSEQAIADRMNIAVSTAHDYVTRLYRHFGVNSRAQLQAKVRLSSKFDPQWTPDTLRRHRRLRPAMPLIRSR